VVDSKICAVEIFPNQEPFPTAMSPISFSIRPHRIAGSTCAALLAVLAVSHANGVSDDLVVVHDTGRLIVNSELTVDSGDVVIEDGGVMEVNDGSTTTATTLEVHIGGLLTGCGTIIANVINMGTILAECGPTTVLMVDGDLNNSGTIYVSNETLLKVTGSLTNTGLLDARGGSLMVPIIIGSGTYLSGVLTGDELQIVSVDIVSDDFMVRALTLSTSEYVMEVSSELSPAAWTQVGFPQSGNDGVLTFFHPDGVTGGKKFYRIREVPAGP